MWFLPPPFLLATKVVAELWESEVLFNSGLQTINTAADPFPVADAFRLTKLEPEEMQFGSFDVLNGLRAWLLEGGGGVGGEP